VVTGPLVKSKSRIFGCGFFVVRSLQLLRVVTVTAQYARSPDDLFASASDPGDLLAVMSDIAVYRGMRNAQFVRGMAFVTDVTFWGWLKIKGHHVHLDSLDSVERCLQSREYSKTVRQWDHLITVKAHPQGAVWTDQVVVDAGWKTYFVALFSRYIYVHRHRRRNALSITSNIQPLRIT